MGLRLLRRRPEVVGQLSFGRVDAAAPNGSLEELLEPHHRAQSPFQRHRLDARQIRLRNEEGRGRRGRGGAAEEEGKGGERRRKGRLGQIFF